MKKLQPPAIPVVMEQEIQQARGAARYTISLVRALRAAFDDIYRVLSRHEPQTGCIVLTAENRAPDNGTKYETAGRIGEFYAWKQVS